MAEEGLSNAEIAERLHIDLRTVKAHLLRAFLEAGVRSRIELMLQWHAGLKQEVCA